MNEKKTTKSKTSKKKKNIKEEPTNKLAYKTIDEIRMENQDLQSINRENTIKINEFNRENKRLLNEIERIKDKNMSKSDFMGGDKNSNIPSLLKTVNKSFINFKESVDNLKKENDSIQKNNDTCEMTGISRINSINPANTPQSSSLSKRAKGRVAFAPNFRLIN